MALVGLRAVRFQRPLRVNEAAVALLLFLRAFAAAPEAEDVREALRRYVEHRGCARAVASMQSREALRLVEIRVECKEQKETQP